MCQNHQSQLVQSPHSSSTAFSILLQGRGTYPSFHILSVLFSCQAGQQSPQFWIFSFFFVHYYKVWCSGDLLHSLIMWLIISSLSPHSLHLLFCWVFSILTLIWLVLMALFCATIRRYSVSLLMFPFLSHVQVFSFFFSFLFHTLRVFHTSFNWWSFTEFKMTASHLAWWLTHFPKVVEGIPTETDQFLELHSATYL